MSEERSAAELSTAEAAVEALSDRYEAALVANDVATLDELFWHHEDVVRFGVAEVQRGFEEVRRWRQQAVPVPTDRWTVWRTVQAFAPDVVAVDLVFRNGEATSLGRQSQLWVRRPEGWRIARAHVSMT